MIENALVEEDFLDFPTVGLASNLGRAAADAVGGGGENEVSMCDRRADVGGRAADAVVAPKELARGRVHSNDAFRRDLNERGDAGDRRDDGGSVSNRLGYFLRAPERLA